MTADSPAAGARPIRLALIGAGPAAIMLLERLLANRGRDDPGLPLEVTLIDPHRPGGGRIWRRDQSPLLKLNSMREDVTVFTDGSCRIDGPIAPGPSLAEWAERVRTGRLPRPAWADAALIAELDTPDPRAFPSRRLNHAYLSWATRRILGGAGPGVSVRWLADSAAAVTPGSAAGAARGHRVRLASGHELTADLVVYALGHSGSRPEPESAALARFAAEHGLRYQAPAFTADLDLDWVAPGADLIVRGMGLAATDLVVLLTEGRGGRFRPRAGGGLSYQPSGREPRILLGSRRGVPYRSKITSRLAGEEARLEYLGPDFHAALAGRTAPLDFDRDIWPLLAAELITGYYRELSSGQPGRTRQPWAGLAPRLRAALAAPGGARSPELARLIRDTVPDPADRFDLEAFLRPLGRADGAGEEPGGERAVHDRVRRHVAEDLRQRTRPEGSATQGLFLAALLSAQSLAEIPAERWNARSRADALPSRWHALFSYIASGPPGHRLEELLALADAGVVRFLGGELSVRADPQSGRFLAAGSARCGSGTARSRASAGALIDAWLPEERAAASENPLLRQLIESGQAAEFSAADAEFRGGTGRIAVAPDGRLPGAAGQFALGPFTSLPVSGAFARPRMNSLPFRLHDRCARAILAEARARADREAPAPQRGSGARPAERALSR